MKSLIAYAVEFVILNGILTLVEEGKLKIEAVILLNLLLVLVNCEK